MSVLKQKVRRQAREIDKLNADIAELKQTIAQLRDSLGKAEERTAAYGEQIERVRGAHLIKQLKEAGIEYQIHTTRWQVQLPAGILSVESLPVAIQSIRDSASPPASIHHREANQP